MLKRKVLLEYPGDQAITKMFVEPGGRGMCGDDLPVVIGCPGYQSSIATKGQEHSNSKEAGIGQ